MITITGYPWYDGIIEGFIYIPWKTVEFLQALNPNLGYDMGFWMGIVVFIAAMLRLFWHGD